MTPPDPSTEMDRETRIMVDAAMDLAHAFRHADSIADADLYRERLKSHLFRSLASRAEPMTREQAERIAERTVNATCAVQWREHDGIEREQAIALVLAGAAARGAEPPSPSLHERIATLEAQVAAHPDALREAASKAWDAALSFCVVASVPSARRARNAYVARTHPPLVARECVLSDGSKVTWRANIFELGGFERVNDAGLISTSEIARELLTQPTDTGADFDNLKAFAASLTEVRRDA